MCCPNCRSNSVSAKYSSSHTNLSCIFRLDFDCYEGEHTHYKCRNCGYKWTRSR